MKSGSVCTKHSNKMQTVVNILLDYVTHRQKFSLLSPEHEQAFVVMILSDAISKYLCSSWKANNRSWCFFYTVFSRFPNMRTRKQTQNILSIRKSLANNSLLLSQHSPRESQKTFSFPIHVSECRKRDEKFEIFLWALRHSSSKLKHGNLCLA